MPRKSHLPAPFGVWVWAARHCHDSRGKPLRVQEFVTLCLRETRRARGEKSTLLLRRALIEGVKRIADRQAAKGLTVPPWVDKALSDFVVEDYHRETAAKGEMV